jgi:hypothetical protein
MPILLKTLLLEAVTDNPNFKKWFGQSQVVDKSGKPLIVYHGTNQSFDKFDVQRRVFVNDSPLLGRKQYSNQ